MHITPNINISLREKMCAKMHSWKGISFYLWAINRFMMKSKSFNTACKHFETNRDYLNKTVLKVLLYVIKRNLKGCENKGTFMTVWYGKHYSNFFPIHHTNWQFARLIDMYDYNSLHNYSQSWKIFKIPPTQ